jgi:hypothetical protein
VGAAHDSQVETIMIARIAFGVACVAALALSPASAQQKSVRVRGTIEQVNGPVLTVKSRDGDTLNVKLTDDARVAALVKASLADIKPGSYVGSTAMPEPDGSWKAVEVHIFPPAMRGVGEGDRPWDLRPKSTMTNGNVANINSGHIAGGTVGGTATTAGGETLTINYQGGEKKIEVTPATVIVTYAAGSRDDLKPGAQIIIPAATRQADGTLVAARINVGRGVAPPM